MPHSRTPQSSPFTAGLFRLASAVLFVAGISLATIDAHAQRDPAPPGEYDPMIQNAVAEFSAAHWAEARALFRRAHEMYPNARTFRGIGMASFELRDYVEAVSALEAALAATRRPLTREQRGQVTALLTRARAFVGRFTVHAVPSAVRLYVDGERRQLEGDWPAHDGTLVLALGTYQITVRDDHGRLAQARVEVHGAEATTLDIDFAAFNAPPAPAHDPFADPAPQTTADGRGAARETRGGSPADALGSAPVSTDDGAFDATPESSAREGRSTLLPWTLVAGGAAVAVAGAVLLGLGLADVHDVENAPRGTEWSDVSSANDRAPALTGWGTALLVAGGGAAALGVALLAGSSSGTGSRTTHDAPAAQLRLMPGTIHLSGTF